MRSTKVIVHDPAKFSPELKYPREIFIVEGTIGIGKSTLIKENFDHRFVKVAEPIDEMREILTRFYSGRLLPDETARAIEFVCLAKIVDGIKVANQLNKHLVIERIPWTRSWLFSKPANYIDDAIESVPSFELGRKIYDNAFAKFDRITFVFLYAMIPFREIRNRILVRGREFEKDISEEYLKLIDARVRILSATIN